MTLQQLILTILSSPFPYPLNRENIRSWEAALPLECSELISANDTSLIALAKQGERAAIDLLFSRHIPALQNMALKFLQNEAEAEDVVQDSVLSAFVHLSQYAGGSKFRTWLISILLNTARTRIRRRKEDRSLSLEELCMTIADCGPNPEQFTESREKGQIVRNAIDDLSPEFRTAYHLCYVKGLTRKEAAAQVGVNPETFKVRLFRGRRKLAGKLLAKIPGAKSVSSTCRNSTQISPGNRTTSKRGNPESRR